jgi:hypothetical protein
VDGEGCLIPDGLKHDDFVNSPISALRFIALPLRRTASTPRDTRFARLDLGLFTKSSTRMTFYEFIKQGNGGICKAS